ncbi:NADH dehydrogenase [ubiquinone] 1 alpha subcomplex assembly factor 2 [Anthonomus grandis grandis]|uniref:NADH dehydrogenase [ubiquinone] 1 alpha subcomplex assembly factor 2 n=1 Tax=Anthonomus grandis grandis TaxID=2921223 RepID=UPI0021660FD7|nr:NADH dehydrogenase [ubiquinone] 1 alpha subcomplex assembly factor 2 [Anthonomus grandis grandis]
MAQPPSRSILKMIITNFINSLKPRQMRGNHMGTDPFGNRFFEIPVNSVSSRTRPSRWFEPPIKDDFQSEMSAEWEAWLRGRRTLPPTEEEVAKNLAIMNMKKINAKEVDAKGNLPAPVQSGMESFPLRPEYERVPGLKQK